MKLDLSKIKDFFKKIGWKTVIFFLGFILIFAIIWSAFKKSSSADQKIVEIIDKTRDKISNIESESITKEIKFEIEKVEIKQEKKYLEKELNKINTIDNKFERLNSLKKFHDKIKKFQ
jgi:hypothetical protein